MLLSVRPCRTHTRLIPPGLLRVPLPLDSAESGLQGFAPTGSPGLVGLDCGLVVCLRSFGFRLATDTLPLSATVRTQLDRQVFHLLENSTAEHTLSKRAGGTIRARASGSVKSLGVRALCPRRSRPGWPARQVRTAAGVLPDQRDVSPLYRSASHQGIDRPRRPARPISR